MVKEWLQKRKEKTKAEQIEKGFGFAMTQYFLHGEPIRALIHRCEMAREFDDFNDFDAGIQKAIDILDRLDSFAKIKANYGFRVIDKVG